MNAGLESVDQHLSVLTTAAEIARQFAD
jgi:hypothetical protein